MIYPEYALCDFFSHSIPYNNFQINRLEEMPPLPTHIRSPHKHLFYEVFLVTGGSMQHNADFQEFQLTANTLFFISQGQLHIWAKNISKPLEGFRLMFHESFLEGSFTKPNFLFELVYLNNIYFNPLLSIAPDAKIRHYFDLLHQEYQDKNSNQSCLQAILYLILNEIQKIAVTDICKTKEACKDLSLYKLFLNEVEKSFQLNISIAIYAEKLCVSVRHLSRLVKNSTELTPLQVIQNRRILEAKRLLKYSDYTINEIAFYCGLEDTSYFIRLFKQLTQTTPMEFRKVL